MIGVGKRGLWSCANHQSHGWLLAFVRPTITKHSLTAPRKPAATSSGTAGPLGSVALQAFFSVVKR